MTSDGRELAATTTGSYQMIKARFTRRNHRRWQPVSVCIVYLLLAVLAYFHEWTGGLDSKVQSNGGNLPLVVWFLAWTAHALTHGMNIFHSGWLNAPAGINVAGNPSNILLGVIVTPVTLVFGPVASYNLLLTVGLAASAASAYFLLRRWTSWWLAAFIGGLLYGFSPFMVASGWVFTFLTFAPLPPLIVLCLDELVVRGTPRPKRWGIRLGLLVVAQFFISPEVLAITALLTIAGVAVLAILHRDQVRSKLRGASSGLAAGSLIAIAVLAYPVWYMAAGPDHVRIVSPAEAYSADLLGWLVPSANQLLATSAMRHLAQPFSGGAPTFQGKTYNVTNGSYIGLPLALALVATVWRYRRLAIVPFFAIITAIAFIGSLGPFLIVDNHITRLTLPGRVLPHLPFLQGIWPYRIELFVGFGTAVLFAVGLDQFHRELAARPHLPRLLRALPVGIVAVVLIPLIPRPYSVVDIPTPQYLQTSAFHAIPAGSEVLMYPFPDQAATAITLLWQAQDGMRYRMVGGCAWAPDGNSGWTLSDSQSETRTVLESIYLDGTTPRLTAQLRMEVSTDLRTWRASTVLVDLAAPGSATAVALFTQILGVSPQDQQGVAVWYRLPSGSGG
jgi:hypothetical protein